MDLGSDPIGIDHPRWGCGLCEDLQSIVTCCDVAAAADWPWMTSCEFAVV